MASSESIEKAPDSETSPELESQQVKRFYEGELNGYAYLEPPGS